MTQKRYPCPHCGRLYSMTLEAVRGVEKGSVVKVHHIEDHVCPSFRTEPPLLPFDPAFQVVPDRDADSIAYSMHRYQRTVR